MIDRRTRLRPVWKWTRDHCLEAGSDLLTEEAPVTIYLNGEELVTLLATPEHLEDLAVGFLTAEGLLAEFEHLETVNADYQLGQVWVSSSQVSRLGEKTFLKRYLTSGCGKGTSFYQFDDVQRTAVLPETVGIRADQIPAIMREFQQESQLFRQTGGVHSAALYRSSGEKVLFREDLGRHNAVDKVLGWCWRRQLTIADAVLVTSGRISSEIAIKTAKAGIQLLISRSAATALAAELAEQVGLTLIGFARGPRFTVYSHPRRLQTETVVTASDSSSARLEAEPSILSVVGTANSGKTTLLEKLVGILRKQGYRVAIIKHAQHFQIDYPGKDSWRYREAGAVAVVLASVREMAVMRRWDREWEPRQIAATLPDVDIIITEGYKWADLPKIEVFREECQEEPLFPPRQLVARVSTQPREEGIPWFHCDDVEGLSRFIIENFLEKKHAQS